MIPKIQGRGSSFAGLAAYLTHDPEEKTNERVAWTHTLNLAHDHVPSAVDEMLWTARAAEPLKQEAGIRAGGRATEDVVKHISLNWSPEDTPSREHMIEATESFLRHMKWDERQVLLVAHNDKAHAHVHLMINAIHPETGLCLNEDFEQRRAQAWALKYELEQGRVHCTQRLANANEREDSPTRPAWLAFREKQHDFEQDEKKLRGREPISIDGPNNPELTRAAEWKILKEHQRDERQGFFAEGKSAFSDVRASVFREVRDEFRDRWSDYYAARREGTDGEALAEIKTTLLAEQKAALEERRDEACKGLRKSRDGIYRELLDDQRETRADLRWRQELGLDNASFLSDLQNRPTGRDMAGAFREAGAEMALPPIGFEAPAPTREFTHAAREEESGANSGSSIGASVTLGLGFGLLSFIGGLGDGLVAAKPDHSRRPSEPEPLSPNPFAAAADDAFRQRQRDEEEAARRARDGPSSSFGD